MSQNIKTRLVIDNGKTSMLNNITKAVFFVFILAVSSNYTLAQGNSISAVKKTCIQALKNNKPNDFVATFSNPIDISLPNKENTYSKTQAKVLMKKFLKNNRTKQFKVKQSGKSTGGSEFIIASLTTEKGIKYQIYLLFTLSNGEAFVHLVEFELEEE